MEQDEVPLPDVLGERKRNPITVEQTLALHPDLKTEVQAAMSVYRELAERSEEASSAEPDPGPEMVQALASAQLGLCVQLDHLYSLMNKEGDELRRQLLTALYSDLIAPWKTIVLQAMFERTVHAEPNRPHERLMKESSIMLHRAREAIAAKGAARG